MPPDAPHTYKPSPFPPEPPEQSPAPAETPEQIAEKIISIADEAMGKVQDAIAAAITLRQNQQPAPDEKAVGEKYTHKMMMTSGTTFCHYQGTSINYARSDADVTCPVCKFWIGGGVPEFLQQAIDAERRKASSPDAKPDESMVSAAERIADENCDSNWTVKNPKKLRDAIATAIAEAVRKELLEVSEWSGAHPEGYKGYIRSRIAELQKGGGASE